MRYCISRFPFFRCWERLYRHGVYSAVIMLMLFRLSGIKRLLQKYCTVKRTSKEKKAPVSQQLHPCEQLLQHRCDMCMAPPNITPAVTIVTVFQSTQYA
jgi:hypothetical protein